MAGGEIAISAERIAKAILLVRGEKVMLDRDLAALYGVEPRVLVQAVKRNLRRFPPDFMFQFSPGEMEQWRSHFVMSNPKAKMGLRRREWPCFPVFCTVNLRGWSTLKSCELSSVCGQSWPLMATLPAIWKPWKGNTMPSSRSFSTPLGNSWPLPRHRPRAKSGLDGVMKNDGEGRIWLSTGPGYRQPPHLCMREHTGAPQLAKLRLSHTRSINS